VVAAPGNKRVGDLHLSQRPPTLSRFSAACGTGWDARRRVPRTASVPSVRTLVVGLTSSPRAVPGTRRVKDGPLQAHLSFLQRPQSSPDSGATSLHPHPGSPKPILPVPTHSPRVRNPDAESLSKLPPRRACRGTKRTLDSLVQMARGSEPLDSAVPIVPSGRSISISTGGIEGPNLPLRTRAGISGEKQMRPIIRGSG
jgi:hypothetical protein